MGYKTEQEDFWNGKFGDEYIERNKSANILSGKVNFWSKVLKYTCNIESAIEFGSNIGLNLKALKILKNQLNFAAVEINHKAAEIMRKDDFLSGQVEVIEQSILDYEVKKQYDMSFVSGVLIHINPDELDCVYDKLYQSSARYICMSEYYNPAPVMVTYRGNEDRLYKRDFAGEFMDRYSNVRLIDYGFTYHRDNNFPADDSTWFLMEKC